MSYNYGFSPYQRQNEYQQFKRKQFAEYQGTYNAYKPKYRSAYKVSGGTGGRRRSHCRVIEKGGIVYITGWKIGKAGFRTFFVSPAKSPKVKHSKTGKEWHSCKVEVINKTQGSKGLFPAWIDAATRRVFVKDLGLMINPQSGYISYLQKKK